MKFVEPRSYADPEAAARKLVEIASTIEPVRNGRVYIELVNAPLYIITRARRQIQGRPRPITRGWLRLHESGTYGRFTESGAALFAWIGADVGSLSAKQFSIRAAGFDPQAALRTRLIHPSIAQFDNAARRRHDPGHGGRVDLRQTEANPGPLIRFIRKLGARYDHQLPQVVDDCQSYRCFRCCGSS
jgi:hypothetical protein